MRKKTSSQQYRVVLLSHRGLGHLKELLPLLVACKIPRKNLLVKIAADDEAEEDFLKKQGVATVKVPNSQFNHGSTREMLRHAAQSRFIVFLTHDIRPDNPNFLRLLLEPLLSGKAAASYARQIPHHDADFFAVFAREFNYPAESWLRKPQDLYTMGADAYFCSNSCAAWDNTALDAVGGFPHTVTGEDSFAAAKLLKHGYCLAYVAESRVYHSHNYTLWQEFTRYFDTGYARRKLRHTLKLPATDRNRGNAFAKSLLLTTWRKRPLLLGYACAHLAAKWIGYHWGILGNIFPYWLCRFFSMQKEYWKKNGPES